MRVSTEKKDQASGLNYFHWVRIIVLFLCLAYVLGWGLTHNTGVSGQITPDIYEVEKGKTIIGCDYLFSDGWAPQFRGKLYPLNESAFSIEWFRYDETTPVKNSTHFNPGANGFEVRAEAYYMANLSRTYGVFKIYWFDGVELIGIENDDGYLLARDRSGVRMYIEDILLVRIGEYDTGMFQ